MRRRQDSSSRSPDFASNAVEWTTERNVVFMQGPGKFWGVGFAFPLSFLCAFASLRYAFPILIFEIALSSIVSGQPSSAVKPGLDRLRSNTSPLPSACE